MRTFRVIECADDGADMGMRHYDALDSRDAVRQYEEDCVLNGFRSAGAIRVEEVDGGLHELEVIRSDRGKKHALSELQEEHS